MGTMVRNLIFTITLLFGYTSSLQAILAISPANPKIAVNTEVKEGIKLKEMTLDCVAQIKSCKALTSQKMSSKILEQNNYRACIIKGLYPLVKNGNLIAPAYIAQAYHALGSGENYEKWIKYFKGQEILSDHAKQEVLSRLENR